MAMDYAVQRLEIGDVVLINLPEQRGEVEAKVVRPIDRTDETVRVSLRVETLEVPPQDLVTRDNVTVKVNAVLYFRVIDARLAVLEVTNFRARGVTRRRSRVPVAPTRQG